MHLIFLVQQYTVDGSTVTIFTRAEVARQRSFWQEIESFGASSCKSAVNFCSVITYENIPELSVSNIRIRTRRFSTKAHLSCD
jgi:hypothetical protein